MLQLLLADQIQIFKKESRLSRKMNYAHRA